MSSDRREFLRQAAIVTAGLGLRALPATAQQRSVAMPTPRTSEGPDMANTTDFIPGGCRFIPAVFQYSAGVAALPGHEIQRITLRTLVPLRDGFRRVEQIITEAGRPLTAFCACELRSPAPFTEQGFGAFNEIYVVTLGKWGIYNGNINPVARSNVCPEFSPPAEPSFHAFSFTTKVEGARPTFVNSGGAETIEGKTIKIIRPGDTSPDGLREKAHFVLGEMERRMVHAGATVFIPANTWISVENIGSDTISLVGIFSAPGFEEFMRDTSVREGEKNVPVSAAEENDLEKKHSHAVIYKQP